MGLINDHSFCCHNFHYNAFLPLEKESRYSDVSQFHMPDAFPHSSHLTHTTSEYQVQHAIDGEGLQGPGVEHRTAKFLPNHICKL